MAPCLFLTALAAYGQSENLQLAEELANDASAVEVPYNPDADASGQVGAEDLIELFIYFGNPLGFQISDDDMSLPNILEQLAGLLVAQQEQIASLEEQLQDQEQAIASLAPLLSLVPVAERSSFGQDTWNLGGLNVRLDNGAGTTYGTSNGLGNLILGTTKVKADTAMLKETSWMAKCVSDRTTSWWVPDIPMAPMAACWAGTTTRCLDKALRFFLGKPAWPRGTWSAILGGLDNRATAANTCISGGHSNTASGDRASVSGGLLNISAGIATSILGRAIRAVVGAIQKFFIRTVQHQQLMPARAQTEFNMGTKKPWL